MERQRLIRLIENKGTSSKEETNELWDIVRTFPYFQTARLLLAKSFHNQSSIHFQNELKAAAAYASDRKILFRLINEKTTPQTAQEENNVFVIEETKPPETYIENQFALAGESETRTEASAFEIQEEATSLLESKAEPATIERIHREEEKIILSHANTSLDEPSTTQEDIIRKRLSEILSKNKPEEPVAEAPAPRIEKRNVEIETPAIKEEEAVTHSVLDEFTAQPADIIEGLEIETIIEENYLQELEKLPEIGPLTPQRGDDALNKASEVNSEQEKNDLPHTFIDWLKQNSSDYTTFEEVKDEPLTSDQDQKEEITSPPSGDRGALINKFIADKPRIAPVKTEFYSPTNMARLSITDNEDIISETLARIYFDQQNYLKARSCYERLTLLYPEKSAFFAPLIEKIDHILKETI